MFESARVKKTSIPGTGKINWQTIQECLYVHAESRSIILTNYQCIRTGKDMCLEENGKSEWDNDIN